MIAAVLSQQLYKGFHIQNVNGYMSRFKGWLRAFNGVASKYLPSYLSWRRTIEPAMVASLIHA